MKMLKTITIMGIWGFLTVAVVFGATHRVPQDYATIQAAINAADEGDTVLVSPGTYTGGNTVDGKNIVIQSVEGPLVTVIDGEHSVRGFRFYNQVSDQTILDGFTIVNGFGSSGGGGP